MTGTTDGLKQALAMLMESSNGKVIPCKTLLHAQAALEFFVERASKCIRIFSPRFDRSLLGTPGLKRAAGEARSLRNVEFEIITVNEEDKDAFVEVFEPELFLLRLPKDSALIGLTFVVVDEESLYLGPVDKNDTGYGEVYPKDAQAVSGMIEAFRILKSKAEDALVH